MEAAHVLLDILAHLAAHPLAAPRCFACGRGRVQLAHEGAASAVSLAWPGRPGEANLGAGGGRSGPWGRRSRLLERG